jgi:hypothetical protein
MNSYVHQYPSALYSVVSETGYRTERNTGEVLRSGRVQRAGQRRRLLGWLRPSSNGDASQPRDSLQPARPAPAPHHFELKFHRERHAR